MTRDHGDFFLLLIGATATLAAWKLSGSRWEFSTW